MHWSPSVCRSAPRSLWLAVTQWWKLGGREWEGDCTPGELLKVCSYILSSYKHSLNVFTWVINFALHFTYFFPQWRTSHIVTLWNWGTCWFGHTCTTSKTWPVTSTMKTTEHTAYRRWPGMRECFGNSSVNCWCLQILVNLICLLHLSSCCCFFFFSLFFFSFHLFSKLAQDNRMESPIPILPLSTPDVETEKLIKMKDEEVWSNSVIRWVIFHRSLLWHNWQHHVMRISLCLSPGLCSLYHNV